jgi:hypothetical protein
METLSPWSRSGNLPLLHRDAPDLRVPMRKLSVQTALALALVLYVSWTAATFRLEGRVLTLLRPEAVGARVLYMLVANLAIGIIGSALVLRRLIRADFVAPDRLGVGGGWRSAAAVLVGGVLGFGAYLIQGAPTLDPVVLLNGFSQVLVVSIAEVLVCWAVLGGVLAGVITPRIGWWGSIPAAIAAAVLFGVYHYAHSPPFNTHAMVAVLTVVGLVTGAFFFVSRDVYGTIVFHNFLALFGVLNALEQAGRLSTFAVAQGALIGGAALAVALLIAVHLTWLRSPTRS